MEKITKLEMAITIEAAFAEIPVEQVRKYFEADAFMAKRIRANASRRKDHLKHQYDHAVEMVKKQSPATEREEAFVRSESLKAYVVVNKAELRELLKKINGRGDSRTGSIALEISMSEEYKSVSGAYQAQIKGITSTR
jgi:hypothetical protein